MSKPSIAVVIGIVAWNEEKTIGKAINSILQQDLFAKLENNGELCQIICVCNGCVDNTASIASSVFKDAVCNHPHKSAISYDIVELEQAGKINALNHFFQSTSSLGAEVLFVMDSDIEIPLLSSMTNLRNCLRLDPEAWFAVPTSIKRSQLESSTFRGSLSNQATVLRKIGRTDKPVWITGQLYCVRGDIAASIYFPRRLLADDMFLSALAHSNFFSRSMNPPDRTRVVKVDSAAYVFDPYLRIDEVLANQKRQAMAHVLQKALIDWVYAELDDSKRGISELSNTFRKKDTSEELWLEQILAKNLRQKKSFLQLLPNMYYTWPLRAVFEGFSRGGLFLLPMAIVRSMTHLLGLYMADRAFRGGQTYFWQERRP